MAFASSELHRLIRDKKKKLDLQEKRFREKSEALLQAAQEQKASTHPPKEDEDTKRARRRVNGDRLFRGCTEEEAEEDLAQIFDEDQLDSRVFVQPDNRATIVIKGTVIAEGDVVRVGKGDALELGRVKALNRSIVTVDCRDREKKFLVTKLQSPRYTIIHAQGR